MTFAFGDLAWVSQLLMSHYYGQLMALTDYLEQFTVWSLRHLTLILLSCDLIWSGVTGSVSHFE